MDRTNRTSKGNEIYGELHGKLGCRSGTGRTKPEQSYSLDKVIHPIFIRWIGIYMSIIHEFLNLFAVIFRFVQDVMLASEKTVDYYNAISTALKLVENTNNKRDTHVSFIIHSFVRSHIHSLIRLFVVSFVRSFIRSFAYSLNE